MTIPNEKTYHNKSVFDYYKMDEPSLRELEQKIAGKYFYAIVTKKVDLGTIISTIEHPCIAVFEIPLTTDEHSIDFSTSKLITFDYVYKYDYLLILNKVFKKYIPVKVKNDPTLLNNKKFEKEGGLDFWVGIIVALHFEHKNKEISLFNSIM